GDDAVTNTVIRLVGVDSVTRDASGTADDIVLRYTVVDGAMPTGEIGAASLFVDGLVPTQGVAAYLNDCFNAYPEAVARLAGG
ncbi:MAG: hypothetical protein ACKOTZ_09080, partial [Chloroflexota bacterium]